MVLVSRYTKRLYFVVLVQNPQVMASNQHFGQQGGFVGGQQFGNPMPVAQQQYATGMGLCLISHTYYKCFLAGQPYQQGAGQDRNTVQDQANTQPQINPATGQADYSSQWIE
jgi:hypothetical protein